MHPIETRLAELGLTLPDAPAPAANYVPFVAVGGLVHVSGQLPMGPEGLIKGKLGADLGVDDGAAAARFCAISLLAQVKKACDGDLSRILDGGDSGGCTAIQAADPTTADRFRSWQDARLPGWSPHPGLDDYDVRSEGVRHIG